MGRTTRTSAAVKSAPSPPHQNPDPEGRMEAVVVLETTTAPVEEGEQTPQLQPPPPPSVRRSSGGNWGLLPASLSPTVVLQKLPFDQINPGPGLVVSGTARRGTARRSAPPPRTTRSRVTSVSIAPEKEESNDEVVELIEIVDEDSKSQDGGDQKPETSYPVNLEEEIECSVIVKDSASKEVEVLIKTGDEGPSRGRRRSAKKSECVVEEMDCDIDDTIMIVDAIEESPEENTHYVVLNKAEDVEGSKSPQQTSDKRSEEDDGASSVSSVPPQASNDGGDGDKSPKPEAVSTTRKSKRQVKVTNKYRDFVVEAPLPSSSGTFTDAWMLREKPTTGGRRSNAKDADLDYTPPQNFKQGPVVYSEDDPRPESPPPTLAQRPLKTYGSSVKKPKKPAPARRKSVRSTTPVPLKENRGRKKKVVPSDWSSLLSVDDETVELPHPNDKNDSTIELNIDSSHITDEEVIKYYDTPSPAEFCGWPEEELEDAGAGTSYSSVSTLSAFISEPCLFSNPWEEQSSYGEDYYPPAIAAAPPPPAVAPKRRGRPPKSATQQAVPAAVAEPPRPAGSTFIKRSYKTTAKSTTIPTGTDVKETPVEVPEPQVTPVEPSEVGVERVETPPESVATDDVLDADAIEIVLQADEIINYEDMPKRPRSRRRIRGGNRSSPADIAPRRGRSGRVEAKMDVDDDALEEVTVLGAVPIERSEETVVAPKKEELPKELDNTKKEEPLPEPILVPEDTVIEPVKSVEELPKKSKHDSSDSRRSRRDSPRRERSKSVSKRRSKSVSAVYQPDKVGQTRKSSVEERSEPSIVPSEPVTNIQEDKKAEESKPVVAVEEKPLSTEVTPVKISKETRKESKESKESHKESKEHTNKESKERKEPSKESSSKERRKSRDYREHTSSSSSKKSKDRDRERDRDRDRDKDRDSSRKDRDASKSSRDKERDKDRDRDRDRKKSSDSSRKDRRPEGSKPKESQETKRIIELPEKKPPPPEVEKKEVKPANVPKLPEKPKKCFDLELQALEPMKKHRSSDKSKQRSESDVKKKIVVTPAVEPEVKKKSSSSDVKSSSSKEQKEKPEKSRSTDSSPVPSKVKESSSGSKHQMAKELFSKKESSSSSSKRKSSSKEESSSRREKETEKAVVKEVVVEDVKPVEELPPIEPQVTEEAPVKVEEPTEVKIEKVEQEQSETLRVATKASRKMYQLEEELETLASTTESVVLEKPEEALPKEEPTEHVKPDVEKDLEQISEAFEATVQVSGPRPEVALQEFENISISEPEPKPVEEDPPSPPRETISPPSQEIANDDSNSNNSSTMDSVKESKGVDLDDGSIRRSSRIKTISSQKQRTSGHGLVKDKDRFLKKTTISIGIESKVLKDAVTGNFNVISSADGVDEMDASVTNIELSDEYLRDMEEKLSRFETIKENLYHCDKVISKEAKKMMCDCFLTGEEIDRGELGCGEDCLNKLLMIECGSRCVVGDRCTNRRFQKLDYANCQVFRTEKKGFGIQATTDIGPGEFIMEYVGEVLNSDQFDERAEMYSKEKNKHYYFMALRSDAVIDATTKGNISRFINHSCDPNAETQKWTVNGELRIGFFSTKYVLAGEEITFDYQFQRYGRKAQKCYCEADNCTGWIGGDPGSDAESEYEDEEEAEESEEEVEATPEVSKDDDVTLEEDKEVAVKEAAEAKEVTAAPVVPKPRKVRKRAEKPKKRRLQIREDPDLEKEINNLLKTGLKNQAQTLKLCRLMVRAKDIKSRSRLLTILQSGELPCRRLFLDYHGLRLLYGWICESTESIEDLKFRIQILDTLDRLPIPNKTMLKDSKIMQTIEKWAKVEKVAKEKEVKEVEKPKTEKETSSTSSPSDSNGAGSSDSNTGSSDVTKKTELVGSAEVLKNMPELLKLADLGKLKEIISSTYSEKDVEKEKPVPETTPTIPSAASLMDSIQIPEPEDENAPEEKRLGTQIRILCCKLLVSWVNLKEVFRIPKKERIEQMKEHEREADLRYKALGLGDDDQDRQPSSRFLDRSRELKRRKSMDDRELLNYHKTKRPLITASPMPKMDNLSKQQRRQLFEMKVAHEEAERRNLELWKQHESNCLKFGLNPHMTNPMDVPARMNPATGEYFSADDRLLPTPPSHMYFKVLPPPMSTNPDDYELPPMDLPSLWRFAIDERGRLYYYHVVERIPQWEIPRKNRPDGLRDEDISMSSDSSTTDTEDSEEEYLNVQLDGLMRKKKRQQSSFNLDDVLAKPGDMNEDLSKSIKDLEAGDSSPQASSSAEKLMSSESLEKTVEELLLHRKRKHSNKLVQEKIISPRTEEDKLYGQMEMKRYKETKEKLRRRKEEAKRLRARSMLDKSLSDSPFGSSFGTSSVDPLADKNSAEADDDLMVSHKIVDDKCIVDELDVLTKKKKISPYEEWQKVKQRLGKKRAAKLGESSSFGGTSSSALGASAATTASTSAAGSSSSSASKVGKRKKPEKMDLNSEEARKIKEKFRGEIAGVIVQHLGSYRKDTCQTGRITNTEDFKHLARKLTHFVLVKELKHCDNTINELEVTDSVRTKAREFIKKYMAKHGAVYVRGENEPDYASINL